MVSECSWIVDELIKKQIIMLIERKDLLECFWEKMPVVKMALVSPVELQTVTK